MGWPAGTCSQFHPYSLDTGKKTFAQKTSLVPANDNLMDLEFRDYAARDNANVLTNQFFVRGSMDNTGAKIQGDTYINKLSAAGGLLPNAINDVVASEGGSPPDYIQHDIFEASISVVALRGRYNERRDFLITTLPPVNETAPASSSALYFPHIADSGGYTTQFILFSGRAGQASSGGLTFFRQSGSDWTLSLR
jgi:hypothetical protein